MKKNITVLLVPTLLASLTLGGCASSTAPSVAGGNQTAAVAENVEQVLHWNIEGGEPTTLDPGLVNDTVAASIITNAFEGLTRLDKDGVPQLAAAESYTVSDDKLTYTFQLRKDAKWTNGEPVTAHDFEWAWKRVLNPATAAEYAHLLYYIKGAEAYHKGTGKAEDVAVKALDNRTLQITLTYPIPFFLELLTIATYFPVHPKTVEADKEWASQAETYISNGPFKLVTWEHKNKLILEKNEQYWDRDAVKLQRIESAMIDDDNTAHALFENGDLDWGGYPAYGLPVDSITQAKQAGTLELFQLGNTLGVIFHTQKAPFSNKKIRQALSYAIDRKTLHEGIFQTEDPIALGFVPPTSPLKPEGYFKDHDVEKAKALLQEGIKELGLQKLPPITYTYATSDVNKKVAEALQEQWRKALGIEVHIQNVEKKVFFSDRRTGNYQVAQYSFGADFNDPINFLELFKDLKSGTNEAFFDNEKYRDLINKSYQEANGEKRKKLLLEAETILMDEMPIGPIIHRAKPYIKNERVKDFQLNTIGGYDFKHAYKVN